MQDLGSDPATREGVVAKEGNPHTIRLKTMADMKRSLLSYYVGVPVVTAVLCGLAYWMGHSRGMREARLESDAARVADKAPEVDLSELTFYRTVKAPEAAPVESVDAPAPRSPALPGSAPSLLWAVQVSAFRDVGRAHKLIDSLKSRGYAAFTRSGEGAGSGGLHRVYVGPMQNREDAGENLDRLDREGFGKGFIVRAPGS